MDVFSILVLKPIQTDKNPNLATTISVDALQTQLLEEGKEFIIINLAYVPFLFHSYSDYFVIPQLLNRCVNFDMNPLQLSTIFDVLYVMEFWLSAPAHYGDVRGSGFILVYLHSPRNNIDCEFIVACYFLWKNEVRFW